MLPEATRKALEESKIIEEKNTSKCYSSGASFIEDISHGFYIDQEFARYGGRHG